METKIKERGVKKVLSLFKYQRLKIPSKGHVHFYLLSHMSYNNKVPSR